MHLFMLYVFTTVIVSVLKMQCVRLFTVMWYMVNHSMFKHDFSDEIVMLVM